MSIYKHKFIVFAIDHFNSLGIIRSLGEKGINPIVVLYGEKSKLVQKSKYISEYYRSNNIEECYEYIKDNYSQELYKPFIIATTDETASCLDLHYDELVDKFHFFNAGEQGRITKMMEKEYIAHLAQSCGLKIPKTEEVNRGDMPKSVKFPIMTKSNTPTIHNWKANVFICNNENELKEAYKHITQERVILQEYIHKKNELNYEGFAINNGQDLYMPYDNRFYRNTPSSYGQYGFIEKSQQTELFHKIKELVKETKFNGIFEIEFLIDQNDNFYFLEINFRSSCWTYAYTKCGINLPIMYSQSVIYGKINTSEEHICKLPFKFMNVIPDFKINVKNGNLTFTKWVKDFLDIDCSFYFNKKDIMPFLYFIKNKIFK